MAVDEEVNEDEDGNNDSRMTDLDSTKTKYAADNSDPSAGDGNNANELRPPMTTVLAIISPMFLVATMFLPLDLNNI